jgi:hypothetical protein
MPLADIELKLLEEARVGRSPEERVAQVPSIMETLRHPYKESA